MIEQITSTRNILGECPVWSPQEKRLYWMDLIEPALYAYSLETRETQHWPMPEHLGGLALRQKGGLVLGMQTRIAAFNPATEELEDLALLGDLGKGVRFNDAKCDARGRFFIGNMMDPSIAEDDVEDHEKEGKGSIFVLDPDLTLRMMEVGFTTPNGFAWDEDDKLLYLADSHENSIYVYDYKLKYGEYANPRVFASTHDEPGVPDGACMDAEGCLWSARHDGGCIVRYRADGSVDRKIHLPVSLPTSLAFGGENLDVLFVTTASQGLSDEQLAAQPEAGTVLALEPGVRGLPVHSFSG